MQHRKTVCLPPPGEQGLLSVTAEKFFLVHRDRPKRLEGTTFDKNGDMYFTSNYTGRVYKLDMNTLELRGVWEDADTRPASVKLHRDGRMFIPCLAGRKSGRLIMADPDGKTMDVLVEGCNIDDVAFDAEGCMYYTQFSGTVYNPTGAVYRFAPDMKEQECFIPHLCGPNGIAFSTDYSVMWLTEFTAGRVLRIPMNNLGLGTVVYHTTGYFGPDSCEVDSDDNLYVCLFNQGRVVILNRDGYPCGQILMPNREVGHNLCGAHAAVRPGTRDCYIACSDDNGNEGSWIMKAPAFAEGCRTAFSLT